MDLSQGFEFTHPLTNYYIHLVQCGVRVCQKSRMIRQMGTMQENVMKKMMMSASDLFRKLYFLHLGVDNLALFSWKSQESRFKVDGAPWQDARIWSKV